MSIHSSSKTITFLHPFTLSGIDEVQPAGTYVVETDVEQIPFLSVAAFKRIATWLRLAARPGNSGLVETALVDPIELETALANDANAGGAQV